MVAEPPMAAVSTLPVTDPSSVNVNSWPSELSLLTPTSETTIVSPSTETPWKFVDSLAPVASIGVRVRSIVKVAASPVSTSSMIARVPSVSVRYNRESSLDQNVSQHETSRATVWTGSAVPVAFGSNIFRSLAAKSQEASSSGPSR